MPWYRTGTQCVARPTPPATALGHEALWLLLRGFGYEREWYSTRIRSADLGGWAFWIMGMAGRGDLINASPIGAD